MPSAEYEVTAGVLKLALFGDSGAGKSTAASYIKVVCEDRGFDFHRVRLSDPLYAAQAAIYEAALRPMEDPTRQDGILLSILGEQLRRINPDCLLTSFGERVKAIENNIRSSRQPVSVIACDDMRAPDWPCLRAEGFIAVEIRSPEELRRERRYRRGDLAIHDKVRDHETHLEFVESSYVVVNDQSLQQFERSIRNLLSRLLE